MLQSCKWYHCDRLDVLYPVVCLDIDMTLVLSRYAKVESWDIKVLVHLLLDYNTTRRASSTSIGMSTHKVSSW